jgi:hypothetical protein
MSTFSKLAATGAVLAACAGCLKIVHDGGDGGSCDGGGVVVPPKQLHAQALLVVNLDRAAANLAGPYAGISGAISTELATNGVTVDQLAVLPVYGGVNGAPLLVYGNPAVGAGDISTAFAALVTSGNFDAPLAGDTAEQFNLATIAKELDTATLPPELTNGSTTPFFGPPVDLFLVITIQPAHRLCADTDPACTISGLDPVSYFSAKAGDGTAGWLKLPSGSYPSGHVYQVFFSTGEAETPSDFASRCGAIPGFPKALLDVMEPSPVKYYGEVAQGLAGQGWHAEQIDLCDAVGSSAPGILKGLAGRIAQAGR